MAIIGGQSFNIGGVFPALAVAAGIVIASPGLTASKFEAADSAVTVDGSESPGKKKKAATLPPVNAKSPVLADRDGDGLADGLPSILAEMSANETISVVITGNGKANAAAAQDKVGPFKVGHEFSLINGFVATANKGQIIALSKLPNVVRVEPTYSVQTIMEGSRRDTGVTALRSALAPAGLGTGAGVGICVVDTGIQQDHEVFVPATGGASKLVAGYYAISNDGNDQQETMDPALLFDGHGHGTFTASIALADGDGDPIPPDSFAGPLAGIAPDADLYVAKALGTNGTGLDPDVGAGIEWCAQQPGVDVINLSISGDAQQSDGLDFMSLIVNAAVQAGKIVVAGAGNSDVPNDIRPPAAAHLAIVVGAYGEWSPNTDFIAAADALDAARGDGLTTQGDYARYSQSFGPYSAAFSTRGTSEAGRIIPDLMAPGTSIAAAISDGATVSQLFECGTGCYEILSGTSMATPMVSGIAALMREAYPAITSDQVRQILFETAVYRGPQLAPEKSYHWGFGLVDAYAAVARARELAGDPSLAGPTVLQIPTGYTFGTDTVTKNSSVSIPFTVDASDAPLAVTVTGPMDAGLHCEEVPAFDPITWQIIYVTICEIRPDLDIEVRAVAGDILVGQSQCPGIINENFPEDCATGLQETVKIASPATGDYSLNVSYLGGVPGEAEYGDVANFVYQISQGPMGAAIQSLPAPAALIADAGTDYTSASTLVDLDASGSSGDIQMYVWSWSSPTNSGSISKTTPLHQVDIVDGETVVATLTVIDDLGFSTTDQVTILVDTTYVGEPNNPPVADAGPNFAIKVGKGKNAVVTVDLLGLGTDLDGSDVLNVRWLENGSEIASASGSSSVPLSYSDDRGKGVYNFTLEVNDGTQTVSDDVCVEVYPGKNPSDLCASEPPPPPPPGEGTGTITGKAKNGKKNASGVSVSVDNLSDSLPAQTAITGKNGQFSFGGLAFGNWILSGVTSSGVGCAAVGEIIIDSDGQIVTQNLAC